MNNFLSYAKNSRTPRVLCKTWWCANSLVQKNIHLYRTASEVLNGIDIKNKSCLITGTSNAIGLEMTKSLLKYGCNVTMACRNPYAAHSALKKMGSFDGVTSIVELDLTSLKSVNTCSEMLLANNRKFDIVLLNADVKGLPYTLTEDNIECTFQVNHLSQFNFIMNLESILAPGGRVVFVTSMSHKNVDENFEHAIFTDELLNLSKKDYTPTKAYNISKLCNILGVRYLAHKWADKPLLVFAACPDAVVSTGWSDNMWVNKFLVAVPKIIKIPAHAAASTPLYCATALELDKASKLYYENCKPSQESGMAQNLSLAYRVCDFCNEMIQMRTEPTEVEKDEGKSDVLKSQPVAVPMYE